MDIKISESVFLGLIKEGKHIMIFEIRRFIDREQTISILFSHDSKTNERFFGC